MQPNAQSALSRSHRDFSTIEVLESRIAPATFTVINLNDSGTGSLRAALALADAHPGPDTIVFHLPAPPLHGENILTLTSGALTSTGDVTIKGSGAGKLIIDGGGNYNDFVFINHATGVDRPVTISGVSLVNGKANPYSYGGGIYSAESLNLKNVIISGNTASEGGGGVWVNGNSSEGGATELTISHSLISGNTAMGQRGGGVFVFDLKSVDVTGTVMAGNTCSQYGGGLYAKMANGGTGVVINGSLFTDNSAAQGGGFELYGNIGAPAPKIVVSSTRVSGNVANGASTQSGGGGGVFIGAVQAVITGSTIENNTSIYNGGGLEALKLSSLAISGSTISGNQTSGTKTASYYGGGGVFINGAGASPAIPATITACHITDNRSAFSGGGVYAVKGVNLTVSSSTISGNNAVNDNGGGICTYSHVAEAVNLAVTGSTISGNTAGYGAGIYAGTGNLTGHGGAFSITASKVTGNSSLHGGGGLYVNGSSSATIKDTTVTGNSAVLYGGGMSIAYVTSFHVSGGSFASNGAGTHGGGIYIGSSVTGSITGVTISGNAAITEGGGVDNDAGTVTLQVAKVTGNTAPLGPEVFGTFTYV
jgi:hypothetical protein